MNQSYEQYKPSGIDWLGDIPNHWEITYLKNCADYVNGAAFKPEDWQHVGVPIVRIQNLNGSEDFNYIDPSKVVNEKAHLYGGELLFSWSGNIGTSFGPFFWRDNTEAYLNQHIFKVENFDLDKRYFYWLLRAVTKYIETKTHGVIGMVHITKPELGGIPVPKIGYTEQRAIAQYLDRKTAQIDDLVARKEQLLALLQRKRQAIINEAVTRGLDATAPKKDSGIEWLGEIPAHWRVTKLKHLTNRIVDGTHFTPNYIESGVPFLRVTDIQSEKIDLTSVKYISQEEHEQLSGRCKPERGDVLLSKNGTIGITKVVNWDWEFSIFVSLCLIKLTEELNPYYFSYFFQSDIVDQQVKEGSKTTSVTNLHLDKIKELLFALPPVAEQVEIIDYLNKKTGRITVIENTIKTQLAYFKTYRQSLISEVVTGKVDVRAKVPIEL